MTSSKGFSTRLYRENFSHCFAPWSGLVFARQVCFLPRKTSWKREQQSKEKRMYRKGDGRRTRDNAKREIWGREKSNTPISSDIRWGGVGNLRRKWSKRNVRSGGCSLSPRIVRRCRCFSLFLYLVVPFPYFTLQIPLLTLTKVDAVVIHLANLLQLHYKEYGESLRNLWFLDMFAFLTA